MQICITQREGVRYFSRFRNIVERDKLEVLVTVENGDKQEAISFDLTAALMEQYMKHPAIGISSSYTEETRVSQDAPQPIIPKRKKREKKPIVDFDALENEDRKAKKQAAKSGSKKTPPKPRVKPKAEQIAKAKATGSRAKTSKPTATSSKRTTTKKVA